MKLSIRHKFMVIVLSLAVPFFIYTGFHYFHTVAESKAAAISRNLLKAKDIAAELDSLIESSQSSLYALALHPSVVKKDSKACSSLFASLLPLYPLHLNILAVDMSGRVFGSAVSTGNTGTLSQSDMEWFSKGVKGVANVTDFQRSRLFSQPSFLVTLPVFSDLGEQVALLGFPVDLHELQKDFVSTEGFDPGATLTVIDNGSNILISTHNDGLVGQRLQQQKILLPLQAASSGSFQADDSNNNPFFYSFAAVEATGWKVVIGVPVADVYAAANRTALNHLFIFLILGGTTGLVSFVYSSVLGRKIEQLIGGFNSIAQGKLDCRLTIPGTDEFSAAAAAFNDMADARQKAEARAQLLTTTLEKRVELRTAELQNAKNELESFSYAVSHDLQAPVRHILAYSQILLEENAARLPEASLHHLQRINRSGENMRNLIIHLLDLSRLGSQQIVAVAVDLGAIAEEILQEVAENDPEHVVEIRIQEGLLTTGDKSLLGIVMRNLLENAWKYGRNAATPLIEVGRTGSEEPAFFVRDNGCGFDMAHAERLFMPFQRLHSADQYEGSGIGLATVFRIISRHGGRIWAESQPEAGAVFYFTLQQTSEKAWGET